MAALDWFRTGSRRVRVDWFPYFPLGEKSGTSRLRGSVDIAGLRDSKVSDRSPLTPFSANPTTVDKRFQNVEAAGLADARTLRDFVRSGSWIAGNGVKDRFRI